MEILLIAGGWSTEREVSLAGARSLETALKSLGHQVTWFDLTRATFSRLCPLAKEHDFAFINLHGSPGEDGLIQAMLDAIQCPYQGSGPAGSLLALHKNAAKQVFCAYDLPTPLWEFLPAQPSANWKPAFKAPWFIKSNSGGSSLRLGKAENSGELEALLEDIFMAGDSALVEQSITGRDLTCGILGNAPLPPVLIEPMAGQFFDYKSKYAKNGAREICPAPISEELTAKVQKLALKVHQILGLRGYSRTDFILTEADELYILEANTLPGMTATSLIPQEANAIGISFPQLLQKLIDLGLEDCQKSTGKN